MHFDNVIKAERYNRHPSGIEVKHVVRLLDFNLGCVFKYVARRDFKEPLRSLQSARFYLQDHQDNYAVCPTVVNLFDALGMVRQYHLTELVDPAKRFYKAFEQLLVNQGELPSTHGLHSVLKRCLEELMVMYPSELGD